jgi:hypothetical protein
VALEDRRERVRVVDGSQIVGQGTLAKDDLMRVMGHESERALAIYTHLFNKAKTDARIREVMERANG